MAGVVESLMLDSEGVKFHTRWSLKFLLSYCRWPFLCLIIKYLKKNAAKQEMKIKKNYQEEIKTVATVFMRCLSGLCKTPPPNLLSAGTL